MPRLPRIELEGSIYFVTAQGSDGEAIFKDRADYQMYMELLTKYKTQHQFKLFSYCLLPDKLYLLIETGQDATISEIMHDVNSLYTKYYNGRYQKRGHLFESRFKSVLVEKAQHLLSMTRHIHRAPGGAIEEYPYSSYHIYVKKASPDGIRMSDEVQEVLSFLKNKDDENAYEKYCLQGDRQEIDELEKRLKRGSVLGSEAFAEQVRQRLSEYAQAQKQSPAKPNRVLIFMVGMGILVATGSSVYLYISKRVMESQYETLMVRREAEFVEKTRFENRSPLVLQDLEGTAWEIEMVPLTADASEGILKDEIRFEGGHFSSKYFTGQGYSATKATLTRRPIGATWETIQSKPGGDTVSWRGDWQGDAMKGMVVVRSTAGKASSNFSFYSAKWSYIGAPK